MVFIACQFANARYIKQISRTKNTAEIPKPSFIRPIAAGMKALPATERIIRLDNSFGWLGIPLMMIVKSTGKLLENPGPAMIIITIVSVKFPEKNTPKPINISIIMALRKL